MSRHNLTPVSSMSEAAQLLKRARRRVLVLAALLLCPGLVSGADTSPAGPKHR